MIFIKVLRRFKVSRVIFIINMAFIAGVILSAVILINAINTLKVHSQLYVEIKNSADATADILPPPMYLIEMYLNSNLLVDAKSYDEKQSIINRINQLKKDFIAREEYWKTAWLSNTERSDMYEGVVPTAHDMIDC